MSFNFFYICFLQQVVVHLHNDKSADSLTLSTYNTCDVDVTAKNPLYLTTLDDGHEIY